MSERFELATIGEIVAGNARAAEVFEEFGIDFCCGGRRSLAEACQRAAVDQGAVVRALEGVARPRPAQDGDDAARWPLDRLIDHIVEMHHGYVRRALPVIARRLERLEQSHGERHRELARVVNLFRELGIELTQHMMKEEQVLFPYIRELVELEQQGCEVHQSPFGTVENPIRMMEREHREMADALRTIRELTGGYDVPADGCITYELSMADLARFERDLHRHVHLENNVLFPAATALEQQRGEAEEA
ncbi:MAG: iron-sulfur cluster repair di-iron protein [Acidobacteria bacterium]|nr:iron-sulfur cluster repair di-iron protein [Acidobacteriota bacterium]